MAFFGGGGASVDLASPSAIGSTTPNTGKFTTLEATTSLQISTSGFLFGGTNFLEQRNLTSAQTFRLYNTFTDASNYERGFFRWNSNILEIGHEVAGTGVNRNVRIITRSQSSHVALGSGSAAGFGINGDGSPSVIIGSSERATFAADGLTLSGDSSPRVAFSGAAAFQNDLVIRRDAAHILAQRFGTNAQTFRLYRTFTDASNYERLGFIATRTTRFAIAAEKAGTGAARSLEISFYTSASDPTSTDITDGCFSVWKNSGTGTIKLWANDGGTMKSVALA
jgi:hypothetical protein